MINKYDKLSDYHRCIKFPITDESLTMNKKDLKLLAKCDPGKIEMVQNDYWDFKKSKFIDDDVKKEIGNAVVDLFTIINLQLIKELKQLNSYIFEATKGD